MVLRMVSRTPNPDQPRLRIYVAGPYTAPTDKGKLENTVRAMDAGLTLYKLGHYPYVPHLSHWLDIRARQTNVAMSWEDWMEWDEVWLESCDALLYLASSPGADRELAQARARSKVIYRSLDEVPKAGR